METREEIQVLTDARQEIQALRSQNEKLMIRTGAIDDMLALFFGRPGIKSGEGMGPDVIFQIDQALADLKKRKGE